MEEQPKYTLAEMRSYLALVLAMEESRKNISENEGAVVMRIFNTIVVVLSDPDTRQLLVDTAKEFERRNNVSHNEIIKEISQHIWS